MIQYRKLTSIYSTQLVSLVLATTLFFGACSVHAEDFEIPRAFGERLYLAYDNLSSGNVEHALSISYKLIDEYERQYLEEQDYSRAGPLFNGLKAANVIAAIIHYQRREFQKIIPLIRNDLKFTERLFNKNGEKIGKDFAVTLNAQSIVSTFIAEMNSRNYDSADKLIGNARDLFGNRGYDIEKISDNTKLFLRLMEMGATSFVQKTGRLPSGNGWMEPTTEKHGGMMGDLMAFVVAFGRSIAYARLGSMEKSMEIIERIIDENRNIDDLSHLLFHKGCILLHEGRIIEGYRLLDKALKATKDFKLKFYLSKIASKELSILDDFINPKSENYLLQIRPMLNININVDVGEDGITKYAKGSDASMGPSFFIVVGE